MYDLFSFYRSKEWQRLLQQIKQERINQEGHIICDYCQKPIVRAYDCIGHHKTELTEENVNDFTISLNPDNIALVHHRCHNYIHNKLGHNQREVYLVYGAPLAGKTSWVKESMQEGDLVVDIDSIWECISGLERYQKPKRLNAVAFKVRDTLLEAVRYRYGKWSNAYIIGGYPNESERHRLAKELGAREILIDATKEECIARLEQTQDNRGEEWKGYIERWFKEYQTTTPHLEE